MSAIFNFNKPSFKERRRDLRKKSTDAEKKLWVKLRNKQMMGYKFFCQYGIGSYILDFYCPSVRLGIELDGSQHIDELKIYDERRSRFLKNFNISVLRFWDNDVLQNTEGVLLKIIDKLKI